MSVPALRDASRLSLGVVGFEIQGRQDHFGHKEAGHSRNRGSPRGELSSMTILFAGNA